VVQRHLVGEVRHRIVVCVHLLAEVPVLACARPRCVSTPSVEVSASSEIACV
jgi:hypothetical protein